MLGISFTELIIIGLAAFLIMGPTRLARAGYELGRLMRRCKDQWLELKTAHLGDIDTTAFYEARAELNKPLGELKSHE